MREWERYGLHSRTESFRVADIGFEAFVHPFVVDGLESMSDAQQGDAHSTVLYMVGIVSRDALSSESLRLRLSVVADALLLIGVGFSCFSLLWLWTAGDRLMLGRRHLVLIFTTGLTAASLYTLFAAGLAGRRASARPGR